MRVIPATRAKIAQEALLGALYNLLEAATAKASAAASLREMDEVAELCADSAKAAAVIALVGRRSQPPRAG